MKKTFQNYVAMALLALASTSPTACAQEQNTVTVRGKITVENTGKSPVGIITLNEKGVADYTVMDNIISTNRHSFMQKDGTFEMTIQKGGTIVVRNGGVRYKDPAPIENITENKNIDLKLIRIDRPSSFDQMDRFEIDFDVNQRVQVSGVVVDENDNLIYNATVFQNKAINEKGANNHIITDSNGRFDFSIQKGAYLGFTVSGYDYQHIQVKNDTVLKVKMQKRSM